MVDQDDNTSEAVDEGSLPPPAAQQAPTPVPAPGQPGLLDQAMDYVKGKWDEGGQNIHNALESAHQRNYAPLQQMATQTAMGTIGPTLPSEAEFAAMELKPAAGGILDRVLDKLGMTRQNVNPNEVTTAMNNAYTKGLLTPQELQGATNALKGVQPVSGALKVIKPGMADGGEVPIATDPSQVQMPIQDAALQTPQQAPAEPTGIPIYNISGPQPVFGHIDPSEVHQAVASGQYSLPKGSSVPVFSPDGQLGDLSAEEAPQAFQSGYRYATPDAIDEHNHSGGSQQALAGLEGLASGVVSKPIAHGLEIASGLTTGKDIEAREKYNPWTSGVTETAGLVGGALTGVGEGAVLAKVGEHVAGEVLGKQGLGLMAKIGARSLSDATQMVLYQGGNEISKMIESNPEQTVGSALTDVGLSGLIGGTVGAALGTVSPLWKASGLADKASQLIEDFKGRLNFLKDNPDLQESLTKELTDHHTGVTSAADEVYGPQGIKAQGISKAMPEMHEGITNQAQGIIDELQSRLAKMKGDPYSYPQRLTSKLEADLNTYKAKVGLGTAADVSTPEVQATPIRIQPNPMKEAFPWLSDRDAPAQIIRGDTQAIQHETLNPGMTKTTSSLPNDIFNATQDLKQQMQGYAKFDKLLTPVDEGYDFVKDAKTMAHSLRTGLEDPEVWGKAGTLQQKVNKAFSDYLPSLKDFQSKFMAKSATGEYQIDPGKISTYLKGIGKPSAEIRQERLASFLDASEKYKSVISDVHQSLGNESPIQPSSLAVARDSLGKPSSGAKLADYFVKQGVTHLAGEALGTGIGAGLGSLVGQPGFGALVGEKALAPFFKSVLPGIAKPILNTASNSAGLKSAIDYGLAAARGEASINRVAKALFKSTGEVGTNAVLLSLQPSETDRAKLHAQLDKIQIYPEMLTQVGGSIGHYLPDHAAAISTQAVTAANYLNNLKPNNSPKLPLDSKLPANPVQQARYNRALDIANQPLLVVKSVQDGRLTPTDVITLKTVNPGAYQRISQNLMSEMTNTLSKGNTVPYKTRINLALLLGQPLDSTMTQQAIMAAQPKPPQTQPPTPTTASSGPKSSTSKLGKVATNTQTIAQSREARGVAKS